MENQQQSYQMNTKLIKEEFMFGQENGLEGLKSQTGKHAQPSKNKDLHLRKPRNKIEELELEIMKKDRDILNHITMSKSSFRQNKRRTN